MTGRQMGGIILVIGVGLLLASILADTIGIGDDPGFGKQQTLGTVVGVGIILLGILGVKKTS